MRFLAGACSSLHWLSSPRVRLERAWEFPAHKRCRCSFWVGAIAFALISTFVPSVAEDILTRGFLLRTLPVQLTAIPYVVLTAMLYTANHVWRFEWGISEQIRLFCLGLAYGAAAWRWRNLWGAVALHWGWNLTNVLVDQLMPIETLSTDHARYLSAAVNLALLAVVVMLPAPQKRMKLKRLSQNRR